MTHIATTQAILDSDISTGDYLVTRMCDLSEPLVSNLQKKFFEPGCGDGNFLVEVLRRRFSCAGASVPKILLAVSNIYGLDVSDDKIHQARRRLATLTRNYIKEHNIAYNYRFWPVFTNILEHNIIVADFLGNWSSIKFISWKQFDAYDFVPSLTTLQEIADSTRGDYA